MAKKEKPMHLFRGAPNVRGWSKYQKTEEGWTLCGIRRNNELRFVEATEQVELVTCPFCLDLMKPTKAEIARQAAAGATVAAAAPAAK